MKKIDSKLTAIALIALLMLLLGCEKRYFDNVWDELSILNPQEWAPKNVQITSPIITHRTISWDYNGDVRIEGFKIDRKRGNESWVEGYANHNKDIRIFSDTISPDQNITYYYKLYAYAGQAKSNILKTSSIAAIPAPSGLTIEKINDISYKLNWDDNATGESGFIIERKTTSPDFIVLDTTSANTASYIDPNVFEGKAPINVQYRIKAFYNQFHSEVAEVTTDAVLSPPSNIQIIKNSISSLTISWNDNSMGEQGFLIERKYQSQEEWENIHTTQSNITTWTDDNFLLNTQFAYRISAFYKSYSSNYVENSLNSHIPPPEHLTYTFNSSTSGTLNWEYSTTGHEGFQLERKINEDPWSVIAPNINHDVNVFTDDQINLIENDYTYRLRVYANSFFSDYAIVSDLISNVTNPATGKTWMDRNLGASRVAQSSTDSEAYGNLYQWGRLADGHQFRSSGTSSSLSSSDTPGHGNFITVGSSPYDWRIPQNNSLWQDINGINNPCPPGYRLPTEAEWEAERQSWSSNNPVGGFNSPLKLPLAGYRFTSNGSLGSVGSSGLYWSSSVDGTDASGLFFNDDVSVMDGINRAYAFSVRCLKN